MNYSHVDEWYIVDGVIDEVAKERARPKATVHYHRYREPCNERCYGVVFNGRARTVDGTIIGQRV